MLYPLNRRRSTNPLDVYLVSETDVFQRMSEVQVDSPPVHQLPTADSGTQSAPVPTTNRPASKRSNFSISNLLAPEEAKGGENLVPLRHPLTTIPEDSKIPSQAAVAAAAAAGSFINASALAHLAHLHGSGASPAPGWDWLGGDSQSLWSR